MKKSILAALATLLFVSFAFADIARPTPKPKHEKAVETTLEIRLDADAKEAKLLIPKSQIKSLRAALDDLDNGNDTSAAATTGLSRTQTIVSGLFMSFALVFGGIWFARSGKIASKGVKTAVITLGIGAVATAATFVYANAGPPAEARSITGKMFSQAVHLYGFGSGRIKIVTSDEAYPMLIVPDPKDGSSGE